MKTATHQITVEELTRLIHGLTDVVKDQITQSKLNQGATDKQIHDLTKAVSDLTNASPAVSATEHPQTLRLPQVNLPSFTGEPKDDLERFLRQLTTLLISSGVPSRHYVTYLKQQTQQDARASDAVSQAEEQHANILHTDYDSSPSNKAYLDYFNAIKETLIQKRGKPKEEKVRELLQEYYTMVQG